MTMFWIGKAVDTALDPIGLMLIAGIAAMGLTAWGHRRLAMGVLALGLAGLWLASTPHVARSVAMLADGPYRPGPLPKSKADAIVVLGGGAANAADASGRLAQLGPQGDRLLVAAALYTAGGAPLVLVSGGDWDPGRTRPEADLMADVLVRLGVPATAILIEDKSKTTQQNAVFSAALLKARQLDTILLVTSAMHMMRASAAFRAVGLTVIAAPADFQTDWSGLPIWIEWLPDPNALRVTAMAWHELVGRFYYGLRGWRAPRSGQF